MPLTNSPAGHRNYRNSALSSAIVSALIALCAVAPTQANERNAQAQETQALSKAGVDVLGQAAFAARRNAVLNVNTPPAARAQSAQTRDTIANPLAGPYYNADGSTTDDLEAAAATWRTDEFLADWAKQAIGAEYAYAMGFTGQGVKVGVFDTGVDKQNQGTAFGDRLHLVNSRDGLPIPDLTGEYEFGPFDGQTALGFSDESWHGTHVAGSIGAERDGVGTHGVAWKANLYSANHYLAGDGAYGMAKIFAGQIPGSDVDFVQLPATAAGINALLAQGVRVINNSWGASFSNAPLPDHNPDDLVTELNLTYADPNAWEYDLADLEAFRAAVANDTVMVFANGNDGSNVHASVQASLPMAFTELESRWVSVAALQDDQTLAGFSQACGHTRYWCVSAPGVDISSPAASRRLDEQGAHALLAEVATYFPSGVDATDFQSLDDWFQNQLSLLPAGAQDPFFAEAMEGSNLMAKAYIDLAYYVHEMYDPNGLGNRIPSSEMLDEKELLNWYKDMFARTDDNDAMVWYYVAVAAGGKTAEQATQEWLAYGDEVTRLLTKYTQVNAGDFLSDGTSMAAPHVSGSLAVVMERFGYLNSAQARDVLLTTAQDLGDAGVDEQYGWGLIDLQKAMAGPGALLGDWNVDLKGATDTWSNDLVNALVYTGRGNDHGKLILDGAGSLALTGSNEIDGFEVKRGRLVLQNDNTVSQETQVNGGLLEIGSSATLLGADLRVNSGAARIDGQLIGNGWVMANGMLTGTGRLEGDLRVEGTLSPGNSMGTFTVDGNYTQAPGSVLWMELTPPDQSDRLDVTGTATLEGGTLKLVNAGGVYALGQRYTVLNADGGLSGRFDTIDSSSVSPFLRVLEGYAAYQVFVDIARGRSVASVANTPNQFAVGAAVDRSPDADPIVQNLVRLFPAQALGALDSLSGQAHPSVRTALVSDSRRIRDLSLQRGRTDTGGSLWIEALSGGTRVHADGNAEQIQTQSRGWVLGGDYRFDGGFSLGGLLGTGNTDMDVLQAGQSRNQGKARHAGVYLGWSAGGFAVKGGYAQSRYDINARRTVAFEGVNNTLHAQYDAQARQAFVDLGYTFNLNKVELEPYARYARVQVKSDAFTETGGIAALRVNAGRTDVNVAQAGLRFSVGLGADTVADAWLRLKAGVSAVRNTGDRVSVNTAGWNSTTAFEVAGTTLSRTMTQADLGIQARLGNASWLDLGYSGRFSGNGNDHTANLRYTFNF